MPGPYRAANRKVIASVNPRAAYMPPLQSLGAAAPQKASPFRTDSPDTGEVARSARRGAVAEQSDGRKGSRPFAAAAHFHHSAGASVASGTGVSSGWGAFASRYA